jgi:hypothetical protein
MTWIRSFAMFWYDFIVGDDWVIALGVIAAIALTALITHHGLDAWWVMPLAGIALLAGSLWRALRKASVEARQR